MDNVELEEFKTSFLNNFGHQVDKIEHIRSQQVYLVSTGSDYCVIKLFKDKELLSWQDKCINQLLEQHMRGLVPFIPNRRRSVVNRFGDKIYGVMPYIPSSPPSFNRMEHRDNSLRLLAFFHRSGHGIYGREPSLTRQSELYERWHDELDQFKLSMDKAAQFNNITDGLLHLVHSFSSDAILWAEAVLERFPHAYMLYLEEQAQWERQVAHRDITPYNFLVHEERYYYIIDYDQVHYAPPYIDLIQFLNLSLPYLKWNFKGIEQLISIYDTIYPLSKDEKQYLPLLLIYPVDLIREWLGVWQRNQVYHPRSLLRYFETVQQQWDMRREFVSHCLAMIK